MASVVMACAASVHADVTGQVRDTDCNPVRGCVITLLAPSDSAFVASDITDASGRFRVQAPSGRYLVNATALGHKPQNLVYDGGELTVVLEAIASDLGEVTVTAAAPGALTREADRYVYLPDALPGEVMTAKDVLKTVPLVRRETTRSRFSAKAARCSTSTASRRAWGRTPLLQCWRPCRQKI